MNEVEYCRRILKELEDVSDLSEWSQAITQFIKDYFTLDEEEKNQLLEGFNIKDLD